MPLARTPLQRLSLLAIWAVGFFSWGANPSQAGGGPENLFLVVNLLNDDSMTIANHYIRLRDIPATNVLYVPWQAGDENCTVDRFRQKLLLPALRAIDRRKLSRQIDYLVYSAGFPWRVDLKKDHPQKDLPKQMRPMASLTGATYLWSQVMSKNASALSLHSNWYASPTKVSNQVKCRSVADAPTRAFRGRYRWTSQGMRTNKADQGQRYLLSTMLGVTSGRGNTVEEVIAYLRRSQSADGTQPGGTFYFMKNNDVRSTTRHACFAGVVAGLRQEGARAQVVTGTAPTGATDIIGLTVGSRTSDLQAAGATVMPGAICEHLTSYGGDMRSKASQMPLSDFLRRGASGASGTVIEPLSIQAKFPLPSVHLHYRRGCSLAEAFYQSVAGPYQLLIVGDPLCQPWAQPPNLVVNGVEADQLVTGPLAATPQVNPGLLTPVRPCEVYLDGQLRAFVATDKKFQIDTTQLTEGHHELRIVATSPDAIEATSRVILPFSVDNDPQKSLQLTASPSWTVPVEGWVELTATVPQEKGPQAEGRQGEGEVIFRHNMLELGRAKLELSKREPGSPSASIKVRARQLGRGPVRISAELAAEGPKATPLWLVVQ